MSLLNRYLKRRYAETRSPKTGLLPPYTGWRPCYSNDTRERHAYAVIDRAIQEYKLDAVYALLSGGYDSLSATWIAAKHPRFAGCIHAETKTGFIANEVTKFVIATCEKLGWHLIRKQPVTTYLMLVVERGYPGAANHSLMYRYLKERPIREAKKDAVKRSGNIGFVTGIRRLESIARAYTPPFDKRDGSVYINPLYDWTKQECYAVIERSKMDLNPIKEAIGISGECGCGSVSAFSELKLKTLMYREEKIYLEKLTNVVLASYEFQQWEVENGLREPEKAMKKEYTTWGHGRSAPQQQEFLPGFSLCNGCELKQAADGTNGDDPDMLLRVAMLERVSS